MIKIHKILSNKINMREVLKVPQLVHIRTPIINEIQVEIGPEP